MADKLTIFLSLTSSQSTPRVSIELDAGTTANQLRQAASDATKVPLDKLKLIYRGRMITPKDSGDVTTEFKLEKDCVVHAMGKPVLDSATSAASNAFPVSNSTPAGASVTPNFNAAAPTGAASSNNTLTATLARLAMNGGDTYRTALSTADKVLGNIVSNPMDEKYRSVKKSNAAFQRRLGGVSGGHEFMIAAGFQVKSQDDGEEYYVLEASEESWPTLTAARDQVARVLAEVNRQSAPPVPPPAAAAFNPMAGLPGMGPGGMPTPDQMSQINQLMSDPSAMSNMLSNPMMEQMMNNHPQFANNPAMQERLQQLRANPQMMQRMSQMMSDPNMMNAMSSMMGNGGGAGGSDPAAMAQQMQQWQQMSQAFGGASGGAGGGSSGAGAPNNSNAGAAGQSGATGSSNSDSGGGNSGNDTEMTEEEMIQEAIRRSMQDQS